MGEDTTVDANAYAPNMYKHIEVLTGRLQSIKQLPQLLP